MSQVSLRDEEIKGLKAETQLFSEMINKKEEEKRLFEDKSKELLEKK